MRQCLRTKSRGGREGRRKEGREGKEGPQENFIYLLFLLSPDLFLWVSTTLKPALLSLNERIFSKQPVSLLVTLTWPICNIPCQHVLPPPNPFSALLPRLQTLVHSLPPPSVHPCFFVFKYCKVGSDCFLFCSYTSLKSLSISWFLILPQYWKTPENTCPV